MRVFVQVILISCLFNTQTTDGELNESNDKWRETEENKRNTYLYFQEFMMVKFKQNKKCLEKSGGTQYYDLLTSECQPCESLENSHERYTLCPEYQLKKTTTELEKADTELDKKLERSNTELEKADTELEKANTELEQANKEMEKKLELMELETRKQVASSNTLAIVAIVLAIVAIVLPTVIIAFVVLYYSRTLRSQDVKQNNIEESVKFLKTHGEPSKDETSLSIPMLESSTEPHQIPKIWDTCKLNDDEIRELFHTIQHSSSKIEEMWILMKSQLEHVSEVVATFPLFTRKLKLVLDGGVDVARPEFCTKLTKEIINFDTSKLQTEELKVEVRYDFSTSSILEVVLRRGKPPQFIKLDIRGLNDDEIRKLFQTIQHSSSKTEEMVIWMKPQLEYVSDVVATFSHLTRKLELVLEGGDGNDVKLNDGERRRRRSCIKLTEEIINFDTSTLQTQELKVEVFYLTIVKEIFITYDDRNTSTVTNRSVNTAITTTPLLDVVLRRGKPPQFTKFAIFEWNDEIRKLFQTIQHPSSKIEDMRIWMNPELEYVTDVVATFPHLTRMLMLKLDGGDDDERPGFCRKLTEEIINFETSKLQTQELKVEVLNGRYYSTTTFLEVVLRRGKPPQFIKLDTSGWNDVEIRNFFQTIQHSSTKIEEMVIWMKPQLEYVSHVVATFPHFTTKLELVLGGGDVDDLSQFCRKLAEEIPINCYSSKLQSKELKVVVRYYRGKTSPPTIFLEVVIRRGKPPQFIIENLN